MRVAGKGLPIHFRVRGDTIDRVFGPAALGGDVRPPPGVTNTKGVTGKSLVLTIDVGGGAGG